jgi:hypothetical protein
VTVENQGTSPLTVRKVDLAGAHTSDFMVNTGGPPPRTLPPGQSWDIALTFRPTAIGLRQAALVVTYAAAGSPARVPLDGIGEAAALQFRDEHMGAEIYELAFSAQQLRTFSQRQTTNILNVGNAPLAVAGIVVEGDFIYNSFCPPVLQPGAACIVQIVFSPTAVGPCVGRLVVVDAATSRSYALSLRGHGAAPVSYFTPTTVDFGDVALASTSRRQSVELANLGDWPLTVGLPCVVGPRASEFSLDVSGCEGSVLRAGETCSVQVALSPTAEGEVTAELQFPTNVSAEPLIIPLRGSGVSAQPLVAPLRRFRQQRWRLRWRRKEGST